MSRILASTLCLGGILFGTNAWATNGISVQSVTADAGESGVEVQIELIHDDTVGGFQVSLTYPADVLQVTDVTQGDYGAGMSIFASEFGTAGEIEALAGAIGGAESLEPGSGTIVTVFFDVDSKAPTGVYDLVLADATLTDAMGADLKVSTTDGAFTVMGSEGTDEGGDDSADDAGGDDGEDDGGSTSGGGPDTGSDAGDEGGGIDTGAGDDGGSDTAVGEEGGSDDGGRDTNMDTGEPNHGNDYLPESGTDGDGCGCSTSASGIPIGGWFAGLMLIGWAGRRRRRD